MERTFQDYPGHFPGDPIVPGAVLVAAAIDELRLHHPAVVGVERVRFLAVVRPGDTLVYDHRLDGSRAFFDARRDGVVVLKGVAVLAW